MSDCKKGERKQIGARVSPDTVRKLKIKALKEGTSTQELIEKWVMEYIKGSR